MRISSNLIGIGVVAIGSLAFGQADLSGERIKAHVRFLSSDLLEGRGVGQRGGQLAEEYLAATLAGYGVRPAGDRGTWFQTVPMVGMTTLPESTLTVSKGGKSVPLTFLNDFVGTANVQEAVVRLDADLVFVGHGIVSAGEKWDDYKGVDVKGKIVVLFTNEPQPDNPAVFKGRTLTYAGRWTYKFEEAARQGAAGCIIIHTTPTAGYGWEVVRNSWGKESPQLLREPGKHALSLAAWVTGEAGARLLALAGHSVAELLKAADSPNFRPIPLGARLKGELRSTLRRIESRNVLGRIEGSDAAHKNETVLFTAHWDHLGVAIPVKGDAIYNGAIDNATGCGVVLEQARVFAQMANRPKRSIVFAFWTAEESGLLGAEYYSAHPVFPPNTTAANINYDALKPSARTRDVVVTGAERTTMWPMVQEAARRFDLEVAPDARPEQGSFYRSDHFMLARIGIPAFKVSLGTRVFGKADDFAAQEFRDYNTNHYHQPSDEFHENWDFASLEQAARFGYLLGLNVANSDVLPKWNPGDEFAVPGR
ncbi:MAG: M28 family peptidase [Bryobacteraceae bacterium]|nr:M28 family peptidase [Bryobacteraceae bacterium]